MVATALAIRLPSKRLSRRREVRVIVTKPRNKRASTSRAMVLRRNCIGPGGHRRKQAGRQGRLRLWQWHVELVRGAVQKGQRRQVAASRDEPKTICRLASTPPGCSGTRTLPSPHATARCGTDASRNSAAACERALTVAGQLISLRVEDAPGGWLFDGVQGWLFRGPDHNLNIVHFDI